MKQPVIKNKRALTPFYHIMYSFIKRYSHLNWTLVDQALVSGTNFFIGIILARYLGLTEFGVYSLAIMVVLLVNVVQMGLVMSPMMSLGSKKKYGVVSYYSYVLVIQVVFNIILLCLFVGVLHLLNVLLPELNIKRLIYPLVTMSTCFLFQDFLRRYYFSLSNVKTVVILDVISYGGQIALISILLGYSMLTVENVLWMMALTSLLSVIYGLLKYRIGIRNFRANHLKAVVKKHWEFGSWVVGSSIFQWLGSQGIIFFAGWFLGAAAVGGIRAVINLMAPVNVLIQALYNFLPARASQIYKESGVTLLIDYLIRSSIFVVVLIAIVGLVVTVFSDDLMVLLYGKEYSGFSGLVVWQAAYICITSGLISFNIFYRTIHETKVLLRVALTAFPVSILSFVMSLFWFQEESVFIGLMVNTLCMVFLYINAMRKYE